MKKRLRIGEVARLLGVTTKTVRHYEKVGLLREPEHSEAGYRLYGADDLLRLRYGALSEGFVPLSEIATVQVARRRAPGPGDGLQTNTEDGGIYLATGGKTDLTFSLHSPRTVQGLLRSAGPATTIHLAADEPQRLASELRERMGEGSRSKPPALV